MIKFATSMELDDDDNKAESSAQPCCSRGVSALKVWALCDAPDTSTIRALFVINREEGSFSSY